MIALGGGGWGGEEIISLFPHEVLESVAITELTYSYDLFCFETATFSFVGYLLACVLEEKAIVL